MGSTAPSPVPAPDSEGVANDFLAAFLADRRVGRERTLQDYQAQFHGHEATVAREWQALAGPGTDEALPAIPQVVIDGVIGRGGQGTVYRGRQPYLDRAVAVKVLAAAAGQPEFVRRFEREARTLAGLTHPHIVACHQAGLTDDGRCYLVMEYVDGPNLRRWLDEHGAMPVAAALRLVRDLVLALQHAQEQGIVHRDVKPENVLLQPDATAPVTFPWRVKLADLGLARSLQLDARLTMATPAGIVLGTPATMAPEQFDAPDQVDHRADLYGLGCVLHHALTGRPAFAAAAMTELMAAKATPLGPDPRRTQAQVPEAVAALTMRLCARAPADRPRSYEALLAELDALLATAAPRARSRRHLVVLALLIAVAVAGVGWATSRSDAGADGDRDPPDPPRAPVAASQPGAPQPEASQPAGPALALGQRLRLFAPGDEPVRDWLEPGTGQWGFDDDTGGASCNCPRGEARAVCVLPRSAFLLHGLLDPRPSYVGAAPPARVQAAGLRCEFGDVGLQVDLRPDTGPTGYRATARQVARAGRAAPWLPVAELGACSGDIGREQPLAVALRWHDGVLTCTLGSDSRSAPVEAALRPADLSGATAGPTALSVHVDRGLMCFREFELLGL